MMKNAIYTVLIMTIILLAGSVQAADDDKETFSSDSVGVKLEHPKGWQVSEYKWGFTITEPETTTSVTVQAFFMPNELEEIYDINMNKEYELVYGDRYKNLDEGEKEISGKTWDYTMAHGGIGTDVEYIDTVYSLLNHNTVYMIEVFRNAAVDEAIIKQADDIVESVKLMYRTIELPMVDRYRKDWRDAGKSGEMLEYSAPGGAFEIRYKPSWIFLGGGSSTEGSFYYITEDPFRDIGMFFVELPFPDPVEAMNFMENVTSQYTSDYQQVSEEEKRINFNTFRKREYMQGQDDHVQYVRYYAVADNDRTLLAIFSYLRKDENNDQDKEIDNFMENFDLVK